VVRADIDVGHYDYPLVNKRISVDAAGFVIQFAWRNGGERPGGCR
jgi:hypothetical protein